jgi:hypothetical protein
MKTTGSAARYRHSSARERVRLLGSLTLTDKTTPRKTSAKHPLRARTSSRGCSMGRLGRGPDGAISRLGF